MNVEIISARPEDTDFIAWIVAQGMHMDGVPPFLKKHGARDNTLYSWQNTRLLRCDGKLASGLIRSNILQVAQNELYDLYLFHASNVWFDFQAGPRKGIGGKTSSIIIYIYTRENPKDGLCRPWQKGDEDLSPYEPPYVEKARKTPQQKLHANVFYGADHQEEIVLSLLSKYLSKRELTYYMAAINREARQCRDCYTQVIQVILEKEK